ncbi:hypothetical protein PUN28_011788 [Cardiocondyla obscurior]|uniref:Uncharacterized protein n=1 Tax=Cardiocondyla obscurior TaxID=286306 RepID=A0AAW2FLC1_9HYME
MIVRPNGTLWAIAVLVLLASVSFSESVKLRKPRRRTTARAAHQQSRVGPVIIKVMHKYTDDGAARAASRGCVNGNCRNAHDKFNLGVNEAISEEKNFLPDKESLRYVVHPEEYERYILKKSTRHASRHKRESIAFSEPHSLNASDRTVIDYRDDANRLPRNLTRVPLYRTNTRNSPRSSSEANRARRSLAADYFSRRNDSDYYAQRRAVMERYYARQREINARYANRTNAASRSEHNDVSQHRPAATNNVLFDFERVYPSANSTARNGTTFHLLSPKTDLAFSNESRYNKIPTELDTRRSVIPEIDLGFKSDADLSQTRSSGNIERNALDFFDTSTPCANLSGIFPSKTRPKNYTEPWDHDHTSADNENVKNTRQWGPCEGKIVYQHNLLLGLTGPSNLDAFFEVIIQGPVCITCVEALRYNETRAVVTLHSGGRGYDHAKLRLLGYKNEGFSYIIKVWGVKKIGQTCDK